MDGNVAKIDLAARGVDGLVHFNAPSWAVRAVMSSNTLPVCPKTGSTSRSLTVHLCLHTALLREIGNAPSSSVWLSFGFCSVGNRVKTPRSESSKASSEASVMACQSSSSTIEAFRKSSANNPPLSGFIILRIGLCGLWLAEHAERGRRPLERRVGGMTSRVPRFSSAWAALFRPSLEAFGRSRLR